MSKKLKAIDFVKRIVFYTVGLFVLAMGISFAITSNLGVSPVSSIPYIVSIVLNIDLGICTTCVFILFILIQIVLMGKTFHMKNLLQIFSSSVFGFFVSATNNIMSHVNVSDFYVVRLLFCLIGVVFVAIGVMLYLKADLIPLPGEGVMQALCYRFHLDFPTSKLLFDCSVVMISSAISVVCLQKLVGIREGTVICAIGAGLCMKLITKGIYHYKTVRLERKG
ncbi:MAG: DUF6198 family protein [Lachnospiraceae bacterium]